jgi:hypothetical protein
MPRDDVSEAPFYGQSTATRKFRHTKRAEQKLQSLDLLLWGRGPFISRCRGYDICLVHFAGLQQDEKECNEMRASATGRTLIKTSTFDATSITWIARQSPA